MRRGFPAACANAGRGAGTFSGFIFPDKQTVHQKEDFIVKPGKKPEKGPGPLEKIPHPFKPLVKSRPAGPLPVLREYFKQIAAAEAEPRRKIFVIADDPSLFSPDALCHEEERRGRLVYGLEKIAFPLTPPAAGVTAHNAEMGKRGADIFFRFTERLRAPAQKIRGEFPLFKDGEQADRKIERHIPDRRFPSQKTRAAYEAF